MAELPPVRLGVHILAAYGAVLLLRRLLETRWVMSAEDVSQPLRQFFFDLAAGLAAGLLASMLNRFFFEFPAASLLSLIAGAFIYGFFIALDMSLSRERSVIQKALARDSLRAPPQRLYSMTRRFTLVAIATAFCVTVVNLMVLARDMSWLATVGTDPGAIQMAVLSIAYEVLFIMTVLLGLAINLIISYSRNLKLLFENETGVLERVTNGDLSRMVPVATRDEFGLIAGHTNTMIEGLRHRIELITALQLAEEVQRTLLPSRPPVVAGLDLSGASNYCQETGGDYYDYLVLPENRLGVVVADVSGHGIDAALFMASARAFLLSEVQSFKTPALLARDVNGYLTRDSSTTGRFMSMFFLEIDPQAKTLRWVRAGHEPALIYDPVGETFRELGGEGMAMGVLDTAEYRDYTQPGWEPGSVIVIGTDGITETRNTAGAFFGAERVRQVVRANASRSAAGIQSAVIEAVQGFREQAAQEDDVTLVVVKLL
jgi:sigma-B regulation protein RsbU (phosphoserine phosphatase)